MNDEHLSKDIANSKNVFGSYINYCKSANYFFKKFHHNLRCFCEKIHEEFGDMVKYK